MKLNQWCQKAEALNTEAAKEYFNMEVGLSYSKKKIGTLENASKKHALIFLKHFQKPEELYRAAVGTKAGTATYKLSLKLHEDRPKKIMTKKVLYNKQPVTWSTWRQFVTTATNKQRKTVFDEFIKKTHLIQPLVEQRFTKIKEILAQHHMDPLTDYLLDHKLTLAQLKDILITLRDLVKKPFHKQWQEYSQRMLKRPPAYYDDFYFMRNKVFEDIKNDFPVKNSLAAVMKTQRALGFDPSRINVDAVDRPKKYPSPFCSFVKIPTDIRVSYKMENPLNTAVAIYHEMGHAIHASHISTDIPYWKKYLLNEGLSETFSTFFEALLSDPEYLTKELNISSEYANKMIARIQFTELYSIAFYTANSLFKIKYWEDALTMDKAHEAYAREIKKSMQINLPGNYWLLHHILPESTMYVPSYMLAMTNSFKLTQELKNTFGSQWWKNKKAGKEIEETMIPGTDSRLNMFNKLPLHAFVRSLLQ